MPHPNIIAMAEKISAGCTTSSDEQATYQLIHHEKKAYNDPSIYCLYHEGNTIALPTDYRLSDIHHLLQYIHPNHNYHIEYYLNDIPNLNTGAHLYSYGHTPNVVTSTPLQEDLCHIAELNLRPIPDIIDEGQSIDNIIDTMYHQITQHFRQTHEYLSTRYHYNYISGQHYLLLPHDIRIDIEFMINRAKHNQQLNIQISTYIHENIHHIDEDNTQNTYVEDHAFVIDSHNAQHQYITSHQHMPPIFQHLIDVLPRYLPNHSQHNIVHICRALTQQQHDPNHPIYATITHYISQFIKHYNIPAD